MSREGRSAPRFAFGQNWRRYLADVTEERIGEAQAALRDMLAVEELAGRSFLDVGCGSGLSSLAAERLGAQPIRSFDFDDDSVAATLEMRRRFSRSAVAWAIERGDILDPVYVGGLGRYDVVHAWGVLHHTGNLWEALASAARLVAPGGTLFVAIYNDQGALTHWWKLVKRAYVHSGRWVRGFLLLTYGAWFGARAGIRALLGRRSPATSRGMSFRRDLVDWVGGHPFEAATPQAVVGFLAQRGFTLENQRTVGRRLGCNQFVLRAPEATQPGPAA